MIWHIKVVIKVGVFEKNVFFGWLPLVVGIVGYYIQIEAQI